MSRGLTVDQAMNVAYVLNVLLRVRPGSAQAYPRCYSSMEEKGPARL